MAPPAASIGPALKAAEPTETNAGQGAPFAGGRQLFRRVKYVAHPDNTGTNFRVKIDGAEYPVRVKFVLSPPPTPNDGKKVEEAAKYFGLNLHDSLETGRAARKFTNELLKDQTFTLRTEGKKDKEGNYLVDLRLGALGNFSKVLVARGFAALHAEDANTNANEDEAAMRELLQGAEKKARNAKEGAWGLSGADENEQAAPEPTAKENAEPAR